MSHLAAAQARPILYIDCFSGIAGDMMLGALMDLDARCDQAIRQSLASLGELGYRLEVERVTRSGIGALRLEVVLDARTHRHERTYAEIRALLEGSALEEPVAARALAMFEALAEAEGRVHRRPKEQVHFHEVGAVDSIVDLVGVAAGLCHLDAEVHSAPVPLGRGFVTCQHGTLPLPAPATLVLLEGVPVLGTELESELVTPTGAVIVKTQALAFGPLPPMRPLASGWGAGARDHASRPGLLRLVLGEPPLERREHSCVVLETNVDDLTAELAAHCLERALEVGALDAWVTPITMKKGRPALQLSVLCRPVDRDLLARLILSESTSLGLRFHDVGRYELERELITVETAYGPLPVKLAHGAGAENLAPEYEACRLAARQHEVPLKAVMAAALAAALRRRGG